MPRKRGKIEEWLKRIRWGGNAEDYIIYIRHRRAVNNVEELKPISGGEIVDVRRGYIVLADGSYIPFHRVEEIKRRNGLVLFSRLKKEDPL